MRLIDKNNVLEDVKALPAELDAETVQRCIEILSNQPTVDAVPVIRCRDCKWYKTNYSWDGKEHRVCVIEAYEPVRKADDFCSRAERKEE